MKKAGILGKLLKPLYDLDDASRLFWLRIKEIFLKMGMRVMEGDEAYYYLFEDGRLKGMVLTIIRLSFPRLLCLTGFSQSKFSVPDI